VHCLLLQLTAYGVIGEAFDLFGKPMSIEVFYRSYKTSVNGALVFAKDPAIRDIGNERMLECIFKIGK
jgi:hypothetical protein